MQHLPFFARLDGRRCLVVGGGDVDARKARRLMRAGAEVTVASPDLNDELGQLLEDGKIRHIHREFGAAAGRVGVRDVSPYWLVIAATSDRELNADVDRAPVTVAISTGGSSPVLARWLKGRIESMLPQGLGSFARLAGRWRTRVRDGIDDLDQRRRFWDWVLESRVPESVYAGREAEAEAALDRLLAEWHSKNPEKTGEGLPGGRRPRPGGPDHAARPPVAESGRGGAL